MALVTPEELYKRFDPTWERTGLDWLCPVQERFWLQLARLRPETYAAMGDNDIVVSKNAELIQILQQSCNIR